MGRLIPAGTGLAEYRDTFVLNEKDDEAALPVQEASSAALVTESEGG